MDMESFFFFLGVTMRRPSIQSKSSQCNASSHPNRKKRNAKSIGTQKEEPPPQQQQPPDPGHYFFICLTKRAQLMMIIVALQTLFIQAKSKPWDYFTFASWTRKAYGFAYTPFHFTPPPSHPIRQTTPPYKTKPKQNLFLFS